MVVEAEETVEGKVWEWGKVGGFEMEVEAGKTEVLGVDICMPISFQKGFASGYRLRIC